MSIERRWEIAEYVDHLVGQGKNFLEACQHAWHTYGVTPEDVKNAWETVRYERSAGGMHTWD